MPTLSKLEHLPPAIKAALIEKILSMPGQYQLIADWLLETHGVKVSRSALGRFAQAVRTIHGGLIDLGVTPAELAAKAGKLEKLGAYLVQQRFISRRIEALEKDIFDDDTKVSP